MRRSWIGPKVQPGKSEWAGGSLLQGPEVAFSATSSVHRATAPGSSSSSACVSSPWPGSTWPSSHSMTSTTSTSEYPARAPKPALPRPFLTPPLPVTQVHLPQDRVVAGLVCGDAVRYSDAGHLFLSAPGRVSFPGPWAWLRGGGGGGAGSATPRIHLAFGGLCFGHGSDWRRFTAEW